MKIVQCSFCGRKWTPEDGVDEVKCPCGAMIRLDGSGNEPPPPVTPAPARRPRGAIPSYLPVRIWAGVLGAVGMLGLVVAGITILTASGSDLGWAATPIVLAAASGGIVMLAMAGLLHIARDLARNVWHIRYDLNDMAERDSIDDDV